MGDRAAYKGAVCCYGGGGQHLVDGVAGFEFFDPGWGDPVCRGAFEEVQLIPWDRLYALGVSEQDLERGGGGEGGSRGGLGGGHGGVDTEDMALCGVELILSLDWDSQSCTQELSRY